MTGAALKITVNDVAALQRLEGIRSRAKDQNAISKIMGEVMRDSIETTFSQEGVPAHSWRRLHASTLATQYATHGKKKNKKPWKLTGLNTIGFLRFANGKLILQNQGRLKNSITYRPASAADGMPQLVIGSNLIYARIHQLGGIIRPKSAKALRFPVATPEGLKWITKKSVTIPARPYLVFRPEDPGKIAAAVQDYLLN
jgi:phage gpG-like protein